MRTIVAIVLLILIIGLGIFEQIYIDRVFKEMENLAMAINKTIEDEDIEGAISLTEDAIDWWDNKLKSLELMVTHIILRDITVQLSDILGQLKGGDSAQAIGACYVLLGMCESVPHLLGFHIQHIF